MLGDLFKTTLMIDRFVARTAGLVSSFDIRLNILSKYEGIRSGYRENIFEIKADAFFLITS